MTTMPALRIQEDSPYLVSWLAHLEYTDRRRLLPAGVCPVDTVRSLQFAPPGYTAEDWMVPGGHVAAGVLRLLLPPSGAPTMPVLGLSTYGTGDTGAVRHELLAVAHRRAAERGSIPVGSHEVAYAEGTALNEAKLENRLPQGVTWNPTTPIAIRQVLELGAPLEVPGLSDSYEMIMWGTVTPDAYLRSCSRLELTMGGGGEDKYVEPERLEDTHTAGVERMRRGRGRHAYHTGIVDLKSNTLVGFTSVSLTASVADRAYQGMTVVDYKHRGRGLGAVLKLANLRQLRAAEPHVRQVETTNDHSNASMLALNRACGYRAVSCLLPWKIEGSP